MADYVVSTWGDFLRYNTGGNTIKFANPHEVNGEIILAGNGSQGNPYIVSTYEEMLFATKATYIWKVKLIDREENLYRYRYISDYDEQRNPIYSEIFCKYDDSLSTIDFNDIQPEGFASRLAFSATSIDFNGWTLLNLYIKYDMLFTSNLENAYRNGRFLNLVYDGGRVGISAGFNAVKYCIFDITTKNTSSQNRYLFTNVPSYSNITIHAHDNVYCSLASSTSSVYNTVINLDVSCYWRFGDPSFDTCLIIGDCETRETINLPLSFSARYTIYNFNSTYTWARPQSVREVCCLNSTKAPNVTSGVDNFKLVTDEVMRSAQDLADLGLPIGVD